MKFLFIDTSTLYLNIAIIDNNKIVFNHKEQVEKDMSSKIIPIIDKGFKECSLNIKDIDKIFVVNGPGSFTGIRIGITIAKVYAWALNLDIITVSSLEAMSISCDEKTNHIPMLDARRGYVFAGIFDKDSNVIFEQKHIKKEASA